VNRKVKKTWSDANLSKVSMREAVLDQLYDIFLSDKRAVLVTDDLGSPSIDKFRENLSDRYINVGIAEQNMINVAAGLALGGKIVFTYGIAPFITMRCYEQIKTALCYMNLPVTCLGVGAGYSYDTAGPTHHCIEDIALMSTLPGMTVLCPSDIAMAAALSEYSYETAGPKYIRLDRGGFPIIFDSENHDISDGLTNLRSGRDVTIIATGNMVHQALSVAEKLNVHSIDAGVIDLYRIKPINEDLLISNIKHSKRLVTLEEHFLYGGIGSIILGNLNDNGINIPIKRIGIPDEYFFEYSGRSQLQETCGLDVNSVTRRILEWIGK